MAVSIDGIIAAQAERASTYSSKADTALREAISVSSSMFGGLETAIINWTPDEGNIAPTTTPQTITARFVAPANRPDAFDRNAFQTLDPIDPMALPAPYVINTDGLFDEVVPTITTPAFSGDAPEPDFTAIDGLLATIVTPTINTVEMPVLANATVGTMPTVTLPTFNATLGGDMPDYYNDVHTRFNAEYARVLPEMKAFIDDGVSRWKSEYAPSYDAALTALEAKLQDGLDRGTALSAEYERALYAKARARTELEHKRTVSDIENGYKKRGFVIPPGSMMAGIAQVNQATASALSAQATDIAIKRSEQEIQHIQFVLNLSANLRQSMAQLMTQYASTIGQICQMADEHAKAYASLLLDNLRVMLERYRAFIEVFKTEADVYETQLKASMAQLDIYKLELEAVKTSTEIDALKLEQVSKAIAIELSKVELFTKLLQSVDTRANVEKTRMEVYMDKVDAYVKRLSGDELKTKIYQAALQGDEAKLKGEIAKLEAYTKTVDAEVAKVEGATKIQGLRAENNRMLVDLYRAELDAYKADLSTNEAVFEGELKEQTAIIEAYKSNKEIELKAYLSKLDLDKMRLSKATDQAQFEAQAGFKYMDAMIQHWNLQAGITRDVGQMYGSIAASALASQNTMTSQATQA